MASPTQWTWVCVDSGNWCWTLECCSTWGRKSQTQLRRLNWTECIYLSQRAKEEGLKPEKQILCKIILYQQYSEDFVFKTPFSKFSSFWRGGRGGGNDDGKQRLKGNKLKEQHSTGWLHQEMSSLLYGYNVRTIISNTSKHWKSRKIHWSWQQELHIIYLCTLQT